MSAVGGKNASLGEMFREMASEGVRVPNGFALTVRAYYERCESRRMSGWRCMSRLDNSGPQQFRASRRSGRREARRIVYDGDRRRGVAPGRSPRLIAELEEQYGANAAVAVRSSATAEDLPTASFAGQHESYLNVQRRRRRRSKPAGAALPRSSPTAAIIYRINNGFDHFKVGLSVGVMKMVRSDRAASGVIFTLDTESGFRDVVFITGSYGLGENVVQGKVDPDEFYVHKPTFRQGYRARAAAHARPEAAHHGLAKGHTGSTTRDEADARRTSRRSSASPTTRC